MGSEMCIRDRANTNDDTLYNTARSRAESYDYAIPVSNGNYLVHLQLAETFFTTEGSRVYDVSIEGNLVIDDLDLVESSGGRFVAFPQTFTTSVSDGVLNIDLLASENNPLINAIVVVSQP